MTILLEDEIDTSRGDMIVKTGSQIEPVKLIEAQCMLACRDTNVTSAQLISFVTPHVKAKRKIGAIQYKVDVNTLEQQPATETQNE